MSSIIIPNVRPTQDGEIHYTTLGMFIIDEIHYGPTDARQLASNVIGGAGILGARLFSPPPLSKTLSWIVDAGHDFPPAILSVLTAFDTNLILRHTPTRATTRGWNSYTADDDSNYRAFRYLTPKLRLTPYDLHTSGISSARSLHVISSPSRLAVIVAALPAATLLIWEPVPDCCLPQHRDEMLQVVAHAAVASPNVGELAAFFSDSLEKMTTETLAQRLLESGALAVVVRAGARGCWVVAQGCAGVWLPAYYEEGNTKVVDPTGAGNTFVGALGVELVRSSGNVLRAAAMGNVAASFAVEQIGLPVLTTMAGAELWNGASVQERWKEYLARLKTRGIDVS